MSVEQLVNNWIDTAVERGASDIHIESEAEDKVRVRIRVDGDLRPLENVLDAKKVLTRLKVMAQLDVNERMPLDGRFQYKTPRGMIDVRVSTAPSITGEKIVLRLIDRGRLSQDLEALGFTPRMSQVYKPLVQSPNGLVLHVGPTGSGKTTSLYAVLRSLNRPEVNIQTVEDPVEYQIAGITQTQVNHDQGLDFARVLRALLRQDPNVILVGEIRDAETASIATEAAMTGHLVLSTLHVNDAVGTVVRLLDMGIAPYCIAYALRVAVAQRFVKRLCESCRKKANPPEALARFVPANRPVFTAGEGCKDCGRSGWSGRIPLFELMPMTPALKSAVYSSRTPDHLAEVAMKNGLISMFQDGLEKVAAGITSFEEMLRATKGVRAPAPAAKPKLATKAVAKPPVAARPAARPAPRPGPRG